MELIGGLEDGIGSSAMDFAEGRVWLFVLEPAFECVQSIKDIGAGVLECTRGDGGVGFELLMFGCGGLSAEEWVTFGEESGEEAGAFGCTELSGFEEESGDAG